MKKLLTVMTVSALALCMSSGMAAHHNSTAKQTQAATQAMSHLFVISAKKAELKKGPDGKTMLLIKKADLDRVIKFSDRPYRMVKYITVSDLAKSWKKGSDSFDVDPPNAVLNADNMKPQIAVITGFKKTDEGVVLTLTGNITNETSSYPLSVTALIMTIDSQSILTKVTGIHCVNTRAG